jgi:hypothetical protein
MPVPKHRFVLITIAVLPVLFPLPVFGLGKAESDVVLAPINTEWVFCVTAFDVSALPPSRRVMGDVLAANLVASLNAVDYRIRVLPEYMYYEATAWSKARLEAGKKLLTKRDQRDLLFFQGNPDWKYRRSLAAIDKEIAVLEAEYKKTEALIPIIGARPDFRLTDENQRGIYPQAPEAGREQPFCVAQKADAFLTARVSEFHGRLYITLKIYALYARSYIYEDSDIFSPEDLNIVAAEISARLTAAIAGTVPAAIAVRADPENAMVMINGSFAGRGRTEILERSPGPVEVSVTAEQYTPRTFSLDLNAGELAELSMSLTPLALSAFNIEIPPEYTGFVYRGALFAGGTPFTMELPLNQYEYIRVETDKEEIGQAVIFGGDVLGNESNTIFIKPRKPKGENDVETARRRFYGAFGRFWFALPVAWIINGLSNSMAKTYNNYIPDPDLRDKADIFSKINTGTMITAGVFLAETLVRSGWYLYVSTRNEPNLVKTKK